MQRERKEIVFDAIFDRASMLHGDCTQRMSFLYHAINVNSYILFLPQKSLGNKSVYLKIIISQVIHLLMCVIIMVRIQIMMTV